MTIIRMADSAPLNVVTWSKCSVDRAVTPRY